MAEIIVNQDYLDALNTHKRSNCPNLSGLNKRQLGQLARKLGLEVVATGVKERADGTGAGTRHNYPNRGKTTWRGTAKERDDRRNRDLNRKFGKMNMDKQRALGQDVLDGVRDRVKKAERERRNEERDKKLEEIQEQQKPKPKKNLKIVDKKITIGDKLREQLNKKVDRKKMTKKEIYQEAEELAKTNEYIRFRGIMGMDERGLLKVLDTLDLSWDHPILDKSKQRSRAIRAISKKVGLEETKRLLKDL